MDARYTRILEKVRRPGRYIGSEINAHSKRWGEVLFRMLLAFPDIYDIGMSHLGIKSLYHIVNREKGMLCERLFTPWTDMEDELRSAKLPVVSLENGRPPVSFDILAFSLPHELNFTNVLNLLDLSGIPLRSEERQHDYPLILAGGPASLNPEAMAPFIDMFLIGEGEEAVLDIGRRYIELSGKGAGRHNKKELLKGFIDIPGIYVPSFYNVHYKYGRFYRLTPAVKGAPYVVKKRIIEDFDSCFYPERQIVPYIPVVHDRISLEIMRGCPNRCNFCQASSIYHPNRLRKKATINDLIERTKKFTGYGEVSLLSLSTANYPGIKELITELIQSFRNDGTSLSLPSLRLEDVLSDLPAIIGRVKKTGFTFAPEVGSAKMRKLINKDVDPAMLLDAVKNAYDFGWKKVKLYFMVGLPCEDICDIDAIIEMVGDVCGLAKSRKRAVTLSVSPFIPKPHTPFQWVAMDKVADLRQKLLRIKKGLAAKRVKIDTHEVEMAVVEAVLSRGDRRVADAIERAFTNGARLDNWSESFNGPLWMDSFGEAGLDPRTYLGPMDHGAPLPWDHIDTGIPKAAFRNLYIASRERTSSAFSPSGDSYT